VTKTFFYGNILLIVVTLLLVALNGIFVVAKFSLVKLRQKPIRAITQNNGLTGYIFANEFWINPWRQATVQSQHGKA
jgi:CBS domain containing-hemolysin-like protein